MTEHVKTDLNFLDKPMWIISEEVLDDRVFGTGRNKYTARVYQDGDYTYQVSGPIPDRFANNVLFVLIKRALAEDTDTLTFNLKQLSEACGKQRSVTVYKNILRSFDAWKKTTITFANHSFRTIDETSQVKFVDGFEDLVFNPIDSWGKVAVVGKSQTFSVRLGKEFLRVTRDSKYYRYTDLEAFQRFTSDVAARLYEILSKSFWKRKEWSIGSRRLAIKLTLNEEYPSRIRDKIISAVKQVNKNTSLQIELKVSQTKDKKDLLFVFTKGSQSQPSNNIIKKIGNKDSLIVPSDILNLIPETNRAGSLNLCITILTTDGVEGLKFYIEKCNSRKQTKDSSYSGYLKTIFDADIYVKHLADKKSLESKCKADNQKLIIKLKQQEEQDQARLENQQARKALAKMEIERPNEWLDLRNRAATNLGIIDLNKTKRYGKMPLILEMIAIWVAEATGCA